MLPALVLPFQKEKEDKDELKKIIPEAKDETKDDQTDEPKE